MHFPILKNHRKKFSHLASGKLPFGIFAACLLALVTLSGLSGQSGYGSGDGGYGSGDGGYNSGDIGYHSDAGGQLRVYLLNSTQVAYLAHTSLSGIVMEGNYSFVEAVDPGGSTIIEIPLMYFNGSVWQAQAALTYPSNPANISSMADIDAYLVAQNLTPVNLSAPFMAQVSAPDGTANMQFGGSVSQSGNLLAVGASWASDGVGAAYLYRAEQNGTATYLSKVTAPDAAANDYLGSSVSQSGNLLAVGSFGSDPGGFSDAGAVHLYRVEQNGSATYLSKVIAPDGGAGDYFGKSVSQSGDILAVGAHTSDPGGTTDSGSAYLYRIEQNGTATFLDKVYAPDRGAGDLFGASLSLSGNLLAVGSHKSDPGGISAAGAAYLFRLEQNGTATYLTKVTAPDATSEDQFGISVSQSGKLLAVGAHYADSGGDSGVLADKGAVYIYRFEENGTATFLSKMRHGGGAASDHFGGSVSLSGNLLVVGAKSADPWNVANAGAVYLYRLEDNGSFTYLEWIVAPNGEGSDNFGYSISQWGDFLAVSAIGADSTVAGNAGAAYLFDVSDYGPGDVNYHTGDGGYQSDDGGYQSDDGGYQSDDGGYQSDDGSSGDGGYHSGDEGYGSGDGGYGSGDGGYGSGDGDYGSGDEGYHTGDGGYGFGDGGYHSGDEGYHTGDEGYHSGDEGYHYDDEGYQTGDEGYHSGDEGYHTGDVGYHSGDEGYQAGEEGYHSGDEGYHTGDEGYHTGDEGYHSGDGGYNSGDGGYNSGDGGYHSGDGDHNASAHYLTKVTAPDGASEDQFGRPVSQSGDILAVGAKYSDPGGVADAGAAYLYKVEQNGTATYLTKVTAPDGAQADQFGISVSQSGDSLAVGAYKSDPGDVTNAGAAYLYKLEQNGTATYLTKVTAPDGAASDQFGISVSQSGDILAVGAQYSDPEGEPDAGAAYLYKVEQNGTATYLTKLTAPDGSASDYFGSSVSQSGDFLVVGAYSANAGAAYLYKLEQNGTVTYLTKVTAPDGAANDYFGYSVSQSGDFLAVGAYKSDPGGEPDAGAAYLYKLEQNGTATYLTKVTAPDGVANDNFGVSVSQSGDFLAVGAYRSDPGGVTAAGAAYLYKLEHNGTATYLTKVTAPEGAANDNFGISVFQSGDVLAVGAVHVSGAGAAYLYDLSDYASGDGGYNSGDGGYSTGDGGYSSGDGGYGSGDGGYGSGDGGYNSGDGGYGSGDGDYGSGDEGYHTGDGGYGSGDGGYSSGDGGYHSGDEGYHTGDGGYGSGDGGYNSGDGGYGSSDGDYGSGDEGYHSGDGGDGSGEGGYGSGDEGYHSGDEGYHTGDEGYHTGDEGYSSGDGDYGSGDEGYHSSDQGYHPSDEGYHTGDEGYHSGDGGYHTGDEGYHSGDEGYHTGDEGYHTGDDGYHFGDEGHLTGDGGYHSSDGGYHSGDEGYHTGDEGYHTGDEGYLTGDGGYHSGDGGYHSGDEDYHTGDDGYHSGDEGYDSGDEGYHSGDQGYHTGDEGYHSGDEGYHTSDDGYHFGDEGYDSGDEGYHSGDGGYHTGDEGYLTGDGGYHSGDGGYHPDDDDHSGSGGDGYGAGDGDYSSGDEGFAPGDDHSGSGDSDYGSGDGGFAPVDEGYHSGDEGYHSGDGEYHPDDDDRSSLGGDGYGAGDGDYSSGDGGFVPGDDHSGSDDGDYGSGDGGFAPVDEGYHSGDEGYHSGDGGYHPDDDDHSGSSDRDYSSGDGGYDSGDESAELIVTKHLPIVRTMNFESENQGLYVLGGTLLADGGASLQETGILLSESLILDPDGSDVARIVGVLGNGNGFAIEVNQLKIDVRYYYRAYAVNEVGLAMGAIKNFVASGDVAEESASVPHEHFDPWVGGEPIEGGWINVDWFGAILSFENGWLYHSDLGWLYALPDGSGGVWLWHAERGWLWTKQGLYPFLYQDFSQDWIYYLGSKDGRPFYFNYSAKQID